MKEFQAKVGLPPDDQVNEHVVGVLHTDVLKACFKTMTQIGQLQSTLQRAWRIAKLDNRIDYTELKGEKTRNYHTGRHQRLAEEVRSAGHR